METRQGNESEGLNMEQLSNTWMEPSAPLASYMGCNTTTQLLVIFVTMEGGYR